MGWLVADPGARDTVTKGAAAGGAARSGGVTVTSALWTTPRRRAVEKFVEKALPRLRLTDWDIRVDFAEDAGAGVIAAIRPFDCQKRAIVVFNAVEFLRSSVADQRHTLVHELLHCHTFDLWDTARLLAEGDAKLEEVVRRRVEWATDAFADICLALVADLEVPGSTAPLSAKDELAARTADPEQVS